MLGQPFKLDLLSYFPHAKNCGPNKTENKVSLSLYAGVIAGETKSFFFENHYTPSSPPFGIR